MVEKKLTEWVKKNGKKTVCQRLYTDELGIFSTRSEIFTYFLFYPPLPLCSFPTTLIVAINLLSQGLLRVQRVDRQPAASCLNHPWLKQVIMITIISNNDGFHVTFHAHTI